MIKKYSLSDIETAFFNYDNDGSENVIGWENRRKEWRLFKNYLKNNICAPEEIAQREAE